MVTGVGLSLLVAYVSTFVIVRCLPRYGFIDEPNERSSHDRPTPTLGGLGVIVGLLAGCLVLPSSDLFVPAAELAALCAILLVLARDELRPMGRLAKLCVQVLAGLTAMNWFGRLELVSIPGGGTIGLGAWGPPLTLLLYVAAQNLYNFMDGIDGLATVEGALASVAFAAVLWPSGPAFAALAAVMGGAVLGFLPWNLPRARIFLGDVGGHLIGLVLVVLAVKGEGVGIPLWVGGAVLGAFLFDSIYTIVRRALRGENVTMAHRFHLYQRLARMGWSHGAINVAYAAHTVVLGGGAIGYVRGWGWGVPLLLAAGVSIGIATVMIETRWSRRQPT